MDSAVRREHWHCEYPITTSEAAVIKTLLIVLLALPLVSFAPVPTAHTVYRVRLAIQTSAPLVQPCTWETAPARLRQQIEDPIGYPFGVVSAWSCDGDTAAVIAELAQRASAMQAEAAAYRQAHSISGVR
jgi:hypothetical protein